VVTPKSIKGKLINDTFTTTNDLDNYSLSILKNATLLEFDRVYNETHKLETIYNEQFKESVSNLFNGKSTCCILFGPSESGKSYTLRGPCDTRSNEYGIFGRVIQDVLNLVELSKQTNLYNKIKSGTYFVAKMSVYQVYLDQVNDLLTNQYNKNMKIEKYFDDDVKLMKTQIADLTEKEIKTKIDYDCYMREAVHNRKSLAHFLRINDSKRKSHLVMSIIIEKRERTNEGFKRSAEKTISRYAQIDFVELASSNYGLSTQGRKNFPEFDEVLFKNTSRTFNSLCNNIVSASIGVVPKYDTKLTLALKNTLNFDSNIIFISCLLPSEEPPKNSMKCLKFTNWLRNQIYNLQCNRDYKIKSAFEDSEEEIVQRDFNRDYDNDYQHDYKSEKRNLYDKYSNYQYLGGSYDNFDITNPNSNKYKRNQTKNYQEDTNEDEDIHMHEMPQRFTTAGTNYLKDDIDRSINMNKINAIDHQGLYDEYQIDRDREIEYERVNTLNKSREKPTQKYPIKNYTTEKEIDSDYIEQHNNHAKNRSPNRKQTKIKNESNVNEDKLNYEKDKKLFEVERSLRDLEAKSLEMSRYLESMKVEKSRIHDDSAHNLNNKRECDWEIEKLKQEASTLKSDNIIFREDINRLSEINRHMEEELARQRGRNLELAAENEKLTQERIQMKNEIEKLTENSSKIKTQEHTLVEQLNLRFITENRIRDLELENRTLREEKQKYEVDYKVLLERHSEMKKLYEQNENELNFLKVKQSEEVSNIEIKLDKMAKEIEFQQRDNNQLRLAEERMRQEISNLEKQRDNYREKYQEGKLKNNLLNSKLTEVFLFIKFNF